MSVIYIAHPVANPDPDTNVRRAKLWLRWCIDRFPDSAFTLPWLPYVEVLDDGLQTHRDRGVRDDMRMLVRCDAVLLCGPTVSSGMLAEATAAHEQGMPVWDLTGNGCVVPHSASHVMTRTRWTP